MNPPTVADFRLRYLNFASVPDATVQYWLDDAARFVTEAWGGDYAPALMAYAAHQLALAGMEAQAGGAGATLPGGVTSFRSGSLSVSVSDTVASAWASGSWRATRYGADFLAMLRRNRGGPIVASAEPCGCR